ncbi:serine hydrolase domain-containing protein [Actinokineospora sp. NBRC 105648]|uniref:serine hydrolase domain-containing protein n=1 Tax=Actinokineospora sp. NBRC 105648 TaxID=3032206 RepID=UPI00249FC441|nr:serine hydrolase domain-containing protein [Actinokineospora sp. NBRC 105648]GLZ36654.1 serine hydrolase [Actinokineospora sp. NBRC 105648]
MDDEGLLRLLEKHRVPGAQLVVRRARVTHAIEAGEERCGSGRAVTAASAFPLGSLTKPFTAALALTLVDDGELDLDEPLPGLGGAVTPRGLLSHTAGLESNVDEDATGPRSRWAARYSRHTLPEFPPGAVFSYSNVGYVLAGQLAEEVTGMDWAEALEAIVLRPLDIPLTAATVSGHAVGERIVPVGEQLVPDLEAPDGGLALSAADLVRFCSADVVEAMCEDQLGGVEAGPFGMADGWGLGWARYRPDDSAVPDGSDGVGATDWFGHDGTGDGTSCHLRFEPATGTAVALTTNAATGPALWADVLAELAIPLGRPAPWPEPVAAWPECAGVYANGGSAFDFTMTGDELVLGGTGSLRCHPDLRFRVRDQSGNVHQGRFLRDPGSGRVDRVQVTGRLAVRRAGGSSW